MPEIEVAFFLLDAPRASLGDLDRWRVWRLSEYFGCF